MKTPNTACSPPAAVDPGPVRAGRSTVYSLFREQARRRPRAVALEFGTRHYSYADVLSSADRMAARLHFQGIERGDRIAVLSENRPEYTILQLAAARIGAIVACLNWRQSPSELEHCIRLVTPSMLVVSSRFAPICAGMSVETAPIDFDALVDEALASVADAEAPEDDPEAGLLLLYTSGTTGRPKAALISQRALMARMCALRLDLGVTAEDAYLAWSPMFHMGGTEHTLSSLMMGASATILDGFDAERICDVLATRRLGWLLLVPATIEPLLERLAERTVNVVGVKVVGCMADLVPAEVIARLTQLVDAPFFNSFGATETGLPPASGGLIPPGVVPAQLSKRLSSLCELRIVTAEGQESAVGEAGEALVRGPTLFSGYWNDPDSNAREFKDGWFRMGDLLRRNADGTVEYVGRSKYMIKSGGENIYPAEVERVLLCDSRVADVAVVRKPDARWGEVPVAFVARRDDSLTADEIEALCRRELAGYKRPREIHFVAFDRMPRSATGKIRREELEAWLREPAQLAAQLDGPSVNDSST